ncbi:MAG: AMP-binding protein [Cognatishimia sp.]
MGLSSQATDGLESIPAILQRNIEVFGTKAAYREKEFGIWQSWTWAEIAQEIEAFALGLITLGVNEGDFVAVIGRNRPYLYWAVVAIQSAGAVPVPIFQDSASDELTHVLTNCGAQYAVVEGQEQVDKIIDILDRLSEFKQLIYVDARGLRHYDHANLHEFAQVQRQGRAAHDRYIDVLKQRSAKLTYDSLCVLLYTSGTTGKPKGVMLSNRNIIESAKNGAAFDRLLKNDEVFAYLPMAWVADFTFSIGQAYWTGLCVSCPESESTVNSDLREIGPTFFFAPPSVFEKYRTNVMIRMADAGWFKKWLFDHFMAHAQKVGPAILDGNPVGHWERLKYRMGEFLVYGPLKNTLGISRVRVAYTAGEAISVELFEFYRGLGVNLKQSYGQTESSVFITAQPDGQARADTVGTPGLQTELRIGDTGEIFFRSPGVFVAYYNNPESTASTKDSEGWVATGDAGFIEPDTGHLRIIDRVKDVGKLRDGRVFAPKFVESKMKFFPEVLEAVLFGNGRRCCVAFINIDLTAVGNWAERNSITFASYQELAGHPRVLDIIQDHVETVNRSVAMDPILSGCQIHRFVVLHKELDADDGEMTRTRKVRRNFVEHKFADLVAALYAGPSEIHTTTEVTYEDGSTGSINARLELRDAAVAPVGLQKMAAE